MVKIVLFLSLSLTLHYDCVVKISTSHASMNSYMLPIWYI